MHPVNPWWNINVFSRRIAVAYEIDGQRQPCALKWLDSFSMRNFTNDAVFDDTLPLSDGVMEIGTRVPLDTLVPPWKIGFSEKVICKREPNFSSESWLDLCLWCREGESNPHRAFGPCGF